MPDKRAVPPAPANILSRRALLGAVPAVAVSASVAAAEPDAAAANDDPTAPAYRETDHIRTFYDRARF